MGVIFLGRRSIFFIDGFNLYHSLDGNRSFHKYKWLDLYKLALRFSFPPYEELRSVRYFTAFASWKSAQTVSRHKAYIKALESAGVQITFGRFQEKRRACRAVGGCGLSFAAHEEKLTDVNIAVGIVEACVTNQCDILYLISGDNDLVPALQTAKRLCPSIKITVVLPINAKAQTLTKICHQNGYTIAKISEQYLADSQFPDRMNIGGKNYTRPSSWT
jgi:uncharacterized LabA/DUF88 family protein